MSRMLRLLFAVGLAVVVNASLVIVADPSLFDEGGNTAKANGGAAQCSNVSCN